MKASARTFKTGALAELDPLVEAKVKRGEVVAKLHAIAHKRQRANACDPALRIDLADEGVQLGAVAKLARSGIILQEPEDY